MGSLVSVASVLLIAAVCVQLLVSFSSQDGEERLHDGSEGNR